MANENEIIIVAPALLELAGSRGGAIEETDYQLALRLASKFRVTLLGPYRLRYEGTVDLGDALSMTQVRFPALKEYPPTSRQTAYSALVLQPIYVCLLAAKLISMYRRKPALLVVHHGLPGLVSAVLAKLMGMAILYSEGNTYPWVSPYLVSTGDSWLRSAVFHQNLIMGRILCRLADCIRTQSDSIKMGMVQERISAAKIQVIPAGVDIDKFTPEERDIPDDGIPRIGFVGRLKDEKGAPLLVETIREAWLSIPQCRFVIMGDGPYRRQLEELPNVEWVGWIPRENLNLWLSRITILLFYQKELGLAEIEAMSAGKAIVASNTGEITRTIRNLENGLLCDPNPRAYAEAIRFLILNPSLVDRLAKAARQTAIEKFSWDFIGSIWLSLCESCIHSKGT